jgi:hypothetical protein
VNKNNQIKRASATPEECAQFVRDAYAYLGFALRGGKADNGAVLATLVHDIGGLARGEDCFSARVSGYAAREEKREWQESLDAKPNDFKGRDSDGERFG